MQCFKLSLICTGLENWKFFAMKLKPLSGRRFRIANRILFEILGVTGFLTDHHPKFAQAPLGYQRTEPVLLFLLSFYCTVFSVIFRSFFPSVFLSVCLSFF